jgi:nucleoside-diphosphate-sugar epimerase
MAEDRKLALITGAAGFVGSRIARRFLREGWRFGRWINVRSM